MTGLENLAGDFIEYVEKVRRFAPPTIRTYKYVLFSFTEYVSRRPVQELTIEELDRYIADFGDERHLKNSSLNTVRCVLRSFFMYIDRYREIRLKFDYSMLRQVKAPRAKIRFVKLDEAKLIIENLKTKQDKLMYTTMYMTGMRIGELVAAQVEDFQTDEITVRGKGGKDRVIPLEPSLSHSIQEHIYAHRLRTGPLFRHIVDKHTLVNTAFTVSGLRKRWQRQLEPLGLYIKPHAARHGIATELLHDGMDIRTLQTLLGHSHIATTMLYTHVTDQQLKESYIKYFPSNQFRAEKLIV